LIEGIPWVGVQLFFPPIAMSLNPDGSVSLLMTPLEKGIAEGFDEAKIDPLSRWSCSVNVETNTVVIMVGKKQTN
jgi:hypothetical protein